MLYTERKWWYNEINIPLPSYLIHWYFCCLTKSIDTVSCPQYHQDWKNIYQSYLQRKVRNTNKTKKSTQNHIGKILYIYIGFVWPTVITWCPAGGAGEEVENNSVSRCATPCRMASTVEDDVAEIPWNCTRKCNEIYGFYSKWSIWSLEIWKLNLTKCF